MITTIQPGDTVQFNAPFEPKLTFVATEIRQYGDDVLAYGEYGCRHVNLLTKIEPQALKGFPKAVTASPGF